MNNKRLTGKLSKFAFFFRWVLQFKKKKSFFRIYKHQRKRIYTLKANHMILSLIYNSVLKTMGEKKSLQKGINL